MTEPTPEWLKKQNLTTDLYDVVKPRLSYEVKNKNDGLLRAVSKEVIQVGYRRTKQSCSTKAMFDELYELIKPRVSVWMQTNQADNLRQVLIEVIHVGYRKEEKKPKAKKVK